MLGNKMPRSGGPQKPGPYKTGRAPAAAASVNHFYLEYNSTMSISSTGTSISSLVGRAFTVPFKFS